jgi:hypothetical protein
VVSEVICNQWSANNAFECVSNACASRFCPVFLRLEANFDIVACTADLSMPGVLLDVQETPISRYGIAEMPDCGIGVCQIA